VNGNVKIQYMVVMCLLFVAKRSFKKAINVTYLVTLSSEMCTRRSVYFTGRCTCEARSKSQWRWAHALPSQVEMLLLDQSKVKCQ